jgi:protein-tyrosine-phosphatase
VTTRPPLRLLFLCTGNSARSQMAEAILNLRATGRIVAASAGSHPAPRVHPLAIAMLGEMGIAWMGHAPQGLEAVAGELWDFVITVCDRAKESCPIFPGRPVLAHWGMPDPAAATGDEAARRDAFRDAFWTLSRRIDLLLALPLASLERLALEERVRAIPSLPETADTFLPGAP